MKKTTGVILTAVGAAAGLVAGFVIGACGSAQYFRDALLDDEEFDEDEDDEDSDGEDSEECEPKVHVIRIIEE